MPDDLLERFRRHDRLALARLLTRVARGETGIELLTQLGSPPKPSRVVAITGSAGVGKSTLVGKLIELLRRQSQTVAVLACDPQSPLSGGALLGDRFRMPASPDDGVFIRSLAAPGGQGAVARNLDSMVRLLEAFGFDVVLIETVGAGQGDTTVRGLADVVVLLLQPETGDDLQWEKAGVLEVADVIAVQKADLPGAENVEAQVRATLSLSDGPPVPVLRVSAKTGEGMEQLWRAVADRPITRRGQRIASHDRLRLAEAVLDRVIEMTEVIRQRGTAERIVSLYEEGSLGPGEAASELLHLLAPETGEASAVNARPA
jgi:LAO/AO transport system ATPase